MDLDLEERKLIANYRRLTESGKKELLSCAASLCRGAQATAAEGGEGTGSCKLARAEALPEAADEPVCTE